jgi:signal transduction histidine kinase
MKDALWVGPLAVFVMLGTFFANGGHRHLSGGAWAAVPLAGLAVLLILGRRIAPGPTLLGVGTLLGVYFAADFSDGPVYLALFVAAYVVALDRTVRGWLPWLAGAASAVIVGMVVRGATGNTGAWQVLVQSVGVAAVAAAAATTASLVRSRAQTAAERQARVATEEQLRMAQELHDGVGHGLAVVAMQAGVALHVLDRDPAAVRSALEAIRDTSRESLEALRAELSRLSGAAPRTPERGLADHEVLADRVRAAGVSVRVVGSEVDAPPPVAQAAYLIVQESLTNVLRHANATMVTVRLAAAPPGLVVEVTDDGTASAVQEEGLGIRSMRSRAEALGGRLTAAPAEDGFAVRAELPIPVAKAAR